MSGTVMTLDDCNQMTFPELTCGALDFPVRTSALPENKKDLQETEADFFTQLLNFSRIQKKRIDPQSYSLKMLKIYYLSIEDSTFSPFSLSWTKSGMMQSGRLSTQPITFRKTERVFIIGHLRGRSGRKVFPIEAADRKNSVSIIGHREGYRRNLQTFSADGITETLSTCQGGGREHCVAIPVLTPDREKKRQNGRRCKENGEDMFTLTSQDRHGVYNGFRIRKLTPKECFRLQGWTDEYFERAALVNSDSQLYKQAGNGVTVPVIYEIARRI